MVPQMTPQELLGFADQVACDLLTIGQENQIPPRDLIMVLAIAQRFVQTVVYHGDDTAAFDAVREAEATYQAASTILRGN